ncbi:hypothetical protein [Helicobacter felis]|nr:hypothetical protein [Helicobacter felis]
MGVVEQTLPHSRRKTPSFSYGDIRRMFCCLQVKRVYSFKPS